MSHLYSDSEIEEIKKLAVAEYLVKNSESLKIKEESVNGDLISITELIDAIIQNSDKICACVYSDGTVKDDCVALILEIINEQPTACNDGWIPVSSGVLPKEGEYVLACVPNNSTNKVIITPYHDIYYWKNGIITHWQPLPSLPSFPQPYKENENE